jgi:hypothetical protein
MVDDQDFEWLSQWKWHLQTAKSNLKYAMRNVRLSSGRFSLLAMHTAIMGRKDGFCVDHIDGDGLNNTRANLRLVTMRQNQQNRHHPKSSRYPGVHMDKGHGAWRACIHIKGCTRHLGCFPTEHRAFMAYVSAVRELGENVDHLTALL